MSDETVDKHRLEDLDIQLYSKEYERMSYAYAHSRRVLRTWFIAYGVGAPAILFSNNEAFQKVAKSGSLGWAAGLLFAGVFLQILIAIIRKAYFQKHAYRIADSFAKELTRLGLKAETGLVPGAASYCGHRLSTIVGCSESWIVDGVTLILFALASIVVGRVLC